MRAVVVESPSRLAVKTVPRPEPLAGEVLVEVAACGICGSDVRYLHGDNPWASQTLGVSKPSPPNMVLGHEFAGMIVDTGSPKDADRIGERVAVLAYRGCGVCRFCRTGRHHLCADVEHIGHAAGWPDGEPNPGGMAEFCRVWAEMAVPLPDAVGLEEACLLDGLAVAVHACHVGSVGLGDHALVLGSGAVGLLILQVARLRGAGRVVCVDTHRKPLDAAQELHADACRQIDAIRDVDDWRDSFDVVFDTVGAADTLAASLALLRRGGRAVLMAHPSETVAIDSRLLSGERTVVTSCNNPYPDFQAAIDLVARGRVVVGPLVTHRFPIEQAPAAFAIAESKDKHDAIKVLLEP